jgi:hypothetical protein
VPDATVSHELHHHDLKSLPGGWVKLRQLSYFEMLVRRDKGSIASMESQPQRKGRRQAESAKMILESLQTWDRDYLFKNCISEHNLTDFNDTPLDFNNKNTLGMLNPVVAVEIEKLIDALNGPEDIDDEDFPIAASNSLEPPKPELPILENPTDTQTT